MSQGGTLFRLRDDEVCLEEGRNRDLKNVSNNIRQLTRPISFKYTARYIIWPSRFMYAYYEGTAKQV